MKKQLILILIVLLSTLSFGQNKDLARAYYKKAGETYNERNYQKAIDYLENAKKQLGATNPDIIYLEIKSRFALRKPDDRIESLVSDFLRESNADDSRRSELTVLLIDYREKKEVFKEEQLKHLSEKELKEWIENNDVNSFINKYLEVTGANKLNTFKSAYLKIKITGKVNMQKEEIFTNDGKFKILIFSSGILESKIVCAGEDSPVIKIKNGMKVELTPEASKNYRKKFYLELFPEFELKDKDSVSLVGFEDFKDKKAYVLKERKSNYYGDNQYYYNTKYYYDPDTFLKLGTMYELEIPRQKASSRGITTYDNYMDYEGVKLAKLSIGESESTNTKVIEELTDVKFNESFTNDDFK